MKQTIVEKKKEVVNGCYYNNRSADEMFKELGYEKMEDYYEGEIYEIIYSKKGEYSTNIMIHPRNEMFKMYYGKEGNKAGWCNIDILQAINKKVEELGWKID